MVRPIRIDVETTARQAGAELDQLAGKTSGLGSKLKSLGKTAAMASAVGLAVAGAAAVKFGAASVKSASDAQQSLGATQTVYGKYADTVIKRSNQAAKAIGVSANQYRELSNVTGALLTGAGMPLKKVADLTGNLNKRAADMAATFGGTTKDAVEAVSSLMKGEADPIERYGVSIKASDVAARLAAQGQDKLTGAAKKQAEMQARVELLMSKTAKTQGAFGRESNTLAHQQQVLGAQFENIKAKVGTALLPVLTSLLTMMNDRIGPAFKAAGEFVAPLVERIKEFFSGVSSGSGALAPFVAVLQTVGQTVMGTIVPAVVSLVQYLLAQLMPVFEQVWAIVSGKVIPIFASVAQFIYGTLVPAVVAIVQKVASNLRPVFEQLVATVQGKVLPAVQSLLAKFQEWLPTIQRVISVVVKIIGKVLEFAAAILGKVLPPLIQFAGWLIGKLVSVIGTVIGWIVKIIGKVLDFGGALIDGGKKVGEFASTVSKKVGDVVAFFVELPGKIRGALTGAGQWLVETGKNIIQGLVNGLDDAKQWVIDKVKAIADTIPSWVKKRLGIASPSKVMIEVGRWVSVGLAVGIGSGVSAVQAALDSVSDVIADGFGGSLAIELKAIEREHDRAAKKIEKTLKGKKNDKARAAALKANERAEKQAARAAETRSAKQQAAAQAVVESYRAMAVANAAALESITQRLGDATSALEEAKKAHADYAKSVRDSMVSAGSIMTLGEGAGFGSVGQMIEQLRAKVDQAKKWAGIIQQLTVAGLNETSLKQLIDAGMEGGLGTAEAIVSGGTAAITEINSLTGELGAVATSMGTATADTFYSAGVVSAQALVSALTQEQAAVLAAGQAIGQAITDGITQALSGSGPQGKTAAKRLAKQLIKAMKEELGIRSPSRVFRAIGSDTARGLLIGLDTGKVAKAGHVLARDLVDGFGSPELTARALLADGYGGVQVQADLSGRFEFSAAEVDQLTRGRSVAADMAAFRAAGGRVDV